MLIRTVCSVSDVDSVSVGGVVMLVVMVVLVVW